MIVKLPSGTTLPASPQNREIARRMWEARASQNESSVSDSEQNDDEQNDDKVTVRELLDELKRQTNEILRLKALNEQEKIDRLKSEQDTLIEMNAERIERLKTEHENERRRMQLEHVNRELDHQRELDDERLKMQSELQKTADAYRNAGGTAGRDETEQNDCELQCSMNSIYLPLITHF